MSKYVYYQPNKMDIKDEYGDCSIRAICKVFECEWIEAFRMTLPLCEKYQVVPSCIFYSKHEKAIEEMLGMKKCKVSVTKGCKRPTVKKFATDHPTGKYIVGVANHVVAVVDGKYYDTWDSGDCSMYSYYVKEN